jgi:hypothetical protein
MPQPQSADPHLSAEGLRTAISATEGTPALLQQGMPGGGAAMVAMEIAAALPGDSLRQEKTPRTEPALSRASQKAETGIAGGCGSGSREGNHSKLFSITAATVPAAMKDSLISRDRRSGASVHAPAGAPWNASCNGNGAGAGPEPAADSRLVRRGR